MRRIIKWHLASWEEGYQIIAGVQGHLKVAYELSLREQKGIPITYEQYVELCEICDNVDAVPQLKWDQYA